MLDVFDREVKASIDDLRKELLKDIGQQKKSAPIHGDNAEQLKKLNDNLNNIIVGHNKEIRAIGRLLKRVADCREQQSKPTRFARQKTKEKSNFKDLSKSFESMMKKNSKRAGKDINDLLADPVRAIMQDEKPFVKRPKIKARAISSERRKIEEEERLQAKKEYEFEKRREGGRRLVQNVTDVFTDPVEVIGNALARASGGIISKVSGFAGGFVEQMIISLIKPLSDQIDLALEQYSTIWTQTGSDIETATELMKKFNVTAEESFIMGADSVKIKKQYSKLQHKGITDEKKRKGITKTGFTLAQQIGSNAEETADMFGKWHQELGLSNFQLNIVERSMRDIARQTGLTGKNLLNVAQSSEKFMMNMRRAGTFTATAGGNIMGLMAMAQKTGTTEGMGRVIKMLSTSILDPNFDKELMRLLAIVGGGIPRAQLLAGTAMNNPASLKIAAQGMERLLTNTISQMTGGRKTKFEQLTPEEAGFVDQQLQRTVGFHLLDLVKSMEQLKEWSKSYAERLDDLNKKQIGATDEKKAEIERQKEGLYLSKSNIALDQFMKNLQATGNFGEAFTKTAQTNKDLPRLLQEANSNIAKGPEAMIDILQKRLKTLTQKSEKYKMQLPPNLLAKAQKALIQNDKKGFEEVVESITDAEKEADRREQIRNDPAAAFRAHVSKYITEIQQILSKFANIILPILTNLLNGNISIEETWKQIKEKFGNMWKDFKETDMFKSFEKTDIFKNLKKIFEYLEDVDWGMVLKVVVALGAFVIALKTVGAVATILSLIKSITGGAGLIAAFSSLSTIIGVVVVAVLLKAMENFIKLQLAIMDINTAIENLSVTAQKFNNLNNKRTAKAIAEAGEEAKAGNVSKLEKKRLALLREENDVQKRINESQKRINESQEKIAKIKEDMEDNENEDLATRAGKAVREYVTREKADALAAEEALQKENIIANKEFKDRKAAMDKQKKYLEDQLKFAKAREKALLETMTAEQKAAKVIEDWWNNANRRAWNTRQNFAAQDIERNEHLKETDEEKFIKQRYLITASEQRKLGIKNRKELGATYADLQDILWKDGPEKAMEYIKKNSTKLNMDIVKSMLDRSMLGVHKTKLPTELSKNLKVGYDQKDFAELSKVADSVGKTLTIEQFLKARELARKRGVEAPTVEDFEKILSNPESIKLSKEQTEYLQRAVDVLKEQIKTAKENNAPVAIIKGLENGLKAVGEMGERALNPGSIYVHDIHVEKLLNALMDKTSELPEVMAPEMPTMTAKLPGYNAFDELKRKLAESKDNDNTEIETNTGNTAVNTRAMVKILNQIGRLLVRSSKGNKLNVQGPDYPLNVFFDDVLPVDYKGGKLDRSIGIEIKGE